MVSSVALPACVHCHEVARALGRRGMCRRCYNTPSVRAKYPPLLAGPDARPALCVHCDRRKNCRPRNLCFPCSGDPGVRSLYPTSTSYHARRGVPDRDEIDAPPVPLPPSPTAAPPGTAAKIAVLIERAAGGFQLFHPRDCSDLSGASPHDLPSVAAADAAVLQRVRTLRESNAARAGRRPGPSLKALAKHGKAV